MCEFHKPVGLSRRSLLWAGTAAALAGPALHARRVWAQDAAPQNAISADAALQRLLDGNARYAANQMNERDYSAGRAARARAQYPIAGVLSCSDSRVAPELAFDQGPGDVFVVRVAGNFVDDDGLASMEYAVQFLGVRLLMVLGHTACGAVDATIKVMKDNVQLPGHLPELVASIKPAVEIAKGKQPADLLAAATEENVRYNAARLAADSPVIGEFAKAGKVKVVGGVYELATGKVRLL